jgi:acylphosphatase
MRFGPGKAGPIAGHGPFYLSPARFGAGRYFRAFEHPPAPTFDRISLLRRRASPVIRVSEQKQGRRFYVSGRVQGVGYRFFVCDAAERQGVSGYARNLRDGRVEVYAMGTEAQLRGLLQELQRGPRLAAVENVSQAEAELLPHFAARFSIERD